MSFKVYPILNSAFPIDDAFAVLQFFIVENDHGKFILNWTSASYKELTDNNLPPTAFAKQNQLGCVRGKWINDEVYVVVQQVVPGKSGSIVQKIQRILEGTTQGQRILIVLDSPELDDEFYNAINFKINHVRNRDPFTLDYFGLDMVKPFIVIPKDQLHLISLAQVVKL